MAAKEDPAQARADQELRLLGPLELWSGGKRTALARSKKTRALLAYLATTGRAHGRERLCALLWDVTDDPRGALRWSLSRLRSALGDDDDRIEASREQVALRTDGMRVDALELSSAVRRGLEQASTEELEHLAALPRGEFLEGLDLTDFMDFHAWCIAERDRFRDAHCAVLAELVHRLDADPARALPHARQRAQTDAFDVRAQTELFGLLLRAAKPDEARQRFDRARRLFREVGAAGLPELESTWATLVADTARAAAPSEPAPKPPPRPAGARAPALWPFVGRKKELSALESSLGAARAGGPPRAVLATGEPGSGKSRLAERLAAKARSGGFEFLSGRAYEAESTRPFGPWVDALRVDVSELVASAGVEDTPGSRDALFAAVATRLAEAGEGHAGVVLLLDDIQWLDSDSAELLHFVTRTYDRSPLLVLLLARGGELSDNEAALRTLRSLRRDARLLEIELEPLSREEIGALLARETAVDVANVFEASAGNPLYAIELARAQGASVDRAPSTLLGLVRERIEQLPDHAADVLRWGAVLGHAMDLERIEALSSLSLDELADALERLERSALLRIDPTRVRERYVFGHDVVREAVYGELSHPRRRLMHKKVAHLLEPRMADVDVATEIAHHAGLAGEALLGVRACIVAANQSLRIFANGDAEALARRGLRLAEELPEADRLTSTLELLHVSYAARAPDREQAAARVRALADQALDLGLTHGARLGFQMLSFLRWESSSMAAAHANIMQAERVSRAAKDPAERSAALAHAAKCLVLLERNMSQAEAFVMEAGALTSRAGQSSSAVSFAAGMIAAHRGELDAAVEAFGDARQLAREQGERLAEFGALEHWVMLEIDRGGLEALAELAETLTDLAGRVRPGAEAPAARGLSALARTLAGQDDTAAALVDAIEELRRVDAKYELSFLLTRSAALELQRDRLDEAEARGKDALDVARAIGRASETALAHVVLAECASRREDAANRDAHLEALGELAKKELSRAARVQVEAALGGTGKILRDSER